MNGENGARLTLWVAVIAGFLTVTATAVSGLFALRLEKQKYQTKLVMRALGAEEEEARINLLHFMIATNLIKNSEIRNGLEKGLKKWKDNRNVVPQVTSSSRSNPPQFVGPRGPIKVDKACTLASAISSANNDTSVGGCSAGDKADTILLPFGSIQTLNAVYNTVYGSTGLPVIGSNITIVGRNSTVWRASSASKFRIFAVAEHGHLALRGITVSGGVAATMPANYENSGLGGGVFNYCGTISLVATTISGNRAREGGGVDNAGHGCYGQGITLTDSIISGNTADRGGGLSNNGSSDLIVTNSTISGNIAGGDGGGVANVGDYSLIKITDSTISGNKASLDCGGMLNGIENSARLTNTTVSGNTAGSNGGGICNQHSLSLTHTTISRNTAGLGGGGMFVDFGSIYGTDLFLRRSLISGNKAAKGSEMLVGGDPPYFNVVAADFNLLGHKGQTTAQAFVKFTPGATDIIATSDGNTPTALGDILNTSLANNGGFTKTHVLVVGSPAVDAVGDGTCPLPARDQRGVRRPQGGNGDGDRACDIGSFER